MSTIEGPIKKANIETSSDDYRSLVEEDCGRMLAGTTGRVVGTW